MASADLHLHSCYSKHPSEWFLQRIGAQESYTAVEDVYQMAKAKGMDYVTLTDHNTVEGAMRMHELHSADTFVSMEATAYFPEDKCKVHILTYDITKEQSTQINRIRPNIYELREYLRAEGIATSVAHATYAVNNRLTLDHLCKLILMFDVFEGINGSRSSVFNTGLMSVLRHLTPAHIEQLQDRYELEPWGNEPWVKGLTAGSDDHAGLFIGNTHTTAYVQTLPDFINAIRNKEGIVGGNHGDHKSLAFSIYKIAHDFSKAQTDQSQASIFSVLNDFLFNKKSPGFKNRMAFKRMKMKKKQDERDKVIFWFIDNIVNNKHYRTLSTKNQLDVIYTGITELSDSFFSMIAHSLEKDFHQGNAAKLLRNVSASLPALFMVGPFFTSMKHQYARRSLLNQLQSTFGVDKRGKEKKVLWFSDTVTDLNGVAVTMNNLAWTAFLNKRPLKLVTTLPGKEFQLAGLPANTINVPCIYTHTPDFYTSFTLRLPSLLNALDTIVRENPDEVVISTPGPIGITGLVCARLLGIPAVGIYHTDFTKQADLFIKDDGMSRMIEGFTRFFYGLVDVIRVPSAQYIQILEQRGFDPTKMKLFKRGIDNGFIQNDAPTAKLRTELGLKNTPMLMYAGRLGKEKNLDHFQRTYEAILEENPEVQLLIVGDGPELEALRRWSKDLPGVHLPGRVPREDIYHYYRLADLFLFPSTTDTFGMVVLEALACGVPCIVTDQGGPQEIVIDGKTGVVISLDNGDRWVEVVQDYLNRIAADPEGFREHKDAIAKEYRKNYGWNAVIDDMLKHEEPEEVTLRIGKRPEASMLSWT